MGDTAMNDRVGVGIVGVDAERLRQPRAVAGLDRREAKTPRLVARGDKADPARAKHADAVVEDHVVVRPWLHRANRHRFFAAAGASAFSALSSSGPAILTPASVATSHITGTCVSSPNSAAD